MAGEQPWRSERRATSRISEWCERQRRRSRARRVPRRSWGSRRSWRTRAWPWPWGFQQERGRELNRSTSNQHAVDRTSSAHSRQVVCREVMSSPLRYGRNPHFYCSCRLHPSFPCLQRLSKVPAKLGYNVALEQQNWRDPRAC